jgi:hypothetical protein
MAVELMVRLDPARLLSSIEAKFPAEQPGLQPGDFASGASDVASDLAAAFGGRAWPELVGELAVNLRWALSFLEARALAYYLPAFMASAVADTRFAQEIGPSLVAVFRPAGGVVRQWEELAAGPQAPDASMPSLSSFCPAILAPDAIDRQEEWQRGRIQCLSVDQLAIVRMVLAWLRDERADGLDRQELAAAIAWVEDAIASKTQA